MLGRQSSLPNESEGTMKAFSDQPYEERYCVRRVVDSFGGCIRESGCKSVCVQMPKDTTEASRLWMVLESIGYRSGLEFMNPDRPGGGKLRNFVRIK